MRGRATFISVSRSPSRCARSPFTVGFMEGPRSDSAAFLATSTQLSRGYADGPPDAPKYGIHVARTVDHLHPDPLFAVVVEHGVRKRVVLVHPLGDRLPCIVGAALDSSTVQDPLHQLA